MKILDLNGQKYSRSSFDDYKIRARVKFKTADDEHNLDIYTTDTDKASIENVLLLKKTDKVISLEIVELTTREQDDAMSKFLDEFLKEK